MTTMTPLERLDWVNLGAFFSVAATVCGFMVYLARQVLSRSFVLRRDHAVLSGKLSGMEQQMSLMATKQDVNGLEGRLRPLEVSIALLGEKVNSVQEGVLRTERMVSILVEHQMAGDRGVKGPAR